MPEAVLVFCAQEFLSNVGVREAGVAGRVKPVVHGEGVDETVAALGVKNRATGTRRSDVDVAHHAVVPQRDVGVFVGAGAHVFEDQVDQHEEVRKPIVPVVGFHAHLHVHGIEVAGNGNIGARHQQVGVRELGHKVLVGNRIHRIVGVVRQGAAFLKVGAHGGRKLKSSAAGSVALRSVVRRG